MAMTLGQTVGDYEIIDILESSKEGVTYKVRNVLVERLEALRVLPKPLQDDQDVVTRFLREAKIHARINHPNVAAFYHATQLDSQLVMTSELVEGTTLERRMELGALPVAEALGYASQVLSALGCAHALGLVHRDVTPSNIILTPDGNVKLTGFGFAKATADPQLTQPGTVIGRLDYISPEQIKGLRNLDGRTDIYSLGVVLYEAVTGCSPFPRKSQFEIMLAHVNELPPAPSIVNPAVPAELSEIILTAMAKDPASRFQTAEEFRRHLDRLRGIPQPTGESAMAPAPPAEGEVVVTQAAPAENLTGLRPAPQWSLWRLAAAALFTFVVVLVTLFSIVRRF
jgi:serine/threonine protein kinase